MHSFNVARLLHLDVWILTSYREQAKASSVRTRELIKGIFRFTETYQNPFVRSRKQVETGSLTYNIRFHMSVHRLNLRQQWSGHKTVPSAVVSTFNLSKALVTSLV